ncbi:MAG: hypothetical protein AABX04_03530 [Nanoarchaeota archaeon]
MKILFCAQDIAGGQALLPLISLPSIGPADEKMLVMAGKSKTLFEKPGVFKNFIDADTDKELFIKVEQFSPDVIVTGTSFTMSIDKQMIEWGRKNDVPTLSIVDHWANYSQRFEHQKYLPNIICVTDELMKEEMKKEGYNKEIIKVTGNPHLDNFCLPPALEKNPVLFISQAFTELEGLDTGYNELIVTKDLIDVFEDKIAPQKMIIRPHPRENIAKYAPFLNSAIVDTTSDVNDLISESKIIVGMSSNVLFKSFLSRKKVISYQPGMIGEDQCILAKLNIKKTITTKKELIKEINREKEFIDQKLIDKYTKNNSTEKVMSEVLKLTS